MQRYRIKPEIQHNFTYDIANLILTTEEWKDKGVSTHALEKASAKDVVVHLYSNSITSTLGHSDISGGFINIRVQFPNDTAADFDLRTENNLPEELIKHIESFFNPPKDVEVDMTPQEDAEFAMWLAWKYVKVDGAYKLIGGGVFTYSIEELRRQFEVEKQSKAHPHQEPTSVTLESFIEFSSWVRSGYQQLGDNYAERKIDFSTKYTLNQLYDKWLSIPQS